MRLKHDEVDTCHAHNRIRDYIVLILVVTIIIFAIGIIAHWRGG